MIEHVFDVIICIIRGLKHCIRLQMVIDLYCVILIKNKCKNTSERMYSAAADMKHSFSVFSPRLVSADCVLQSRLADLFLPVPCL